MNIQVTGFFLRVTPSSPWYSFTESVEVNGSAADEPPGSMKYSTYVPLYGVNADNSTFLEDGTLNVFGDNYSNDVDGMDARKWPMPVKIFL